MNERIEKMISESIKAIPDRVDFEIPDEFTQRFAELIAADEREACAKVCEKQEYYGPLCGTPEDCAAAIRARGQA